MQKNISNNSSSLSLYFIIFIRYDFFSKVNGPLWVDTEPKCFILLTITIDLVLRLVSHIFLRSIRLFSFLSNSIDKLNFKHNFKISLAMLHASPANIHEYVLHSITKRIHDTIWQRNFRGREYVSNSNNSINFYFFDLKTYRIYFYVGI